MDYDDLKFKPGEVVYNAHFGEFVRIDEVNANWTLDRDEALLMYKVFSKERGIFYETRGTQFAKFYKSNNPFRKNKF